MPRINHALDGMKHDETMTYLEHGAIQWGVSCRIDGLIVHIEGPTIPTGQFDLIGLL